MDFCPVNAPAFYTYMMCNLKPERYALFIETLTMHANDGVKLDGIIVTLNRDDIYLGSIKLSSSTKSIID